MGAPSGSSHHTCHNSFVILNIIMSDTALELPGMCCSGHVSYPLLYIFVQLISPDERNCLGASLPFFRGWFHRPIRGAFLSFLSRCVTRALRVEMAPYIPYFTQASKRGWPFLSRCFQNRRARQVYTMEDGYAKSTLMRSPRLRGLCGTKNNGGNETPHPATMSKPSFPAPPHHLHTTPGPSFPSFSFESLPQ